MTKKGVKAVSEEVTEFTLIRESYGFTKSEVAKEIGISEPVYSLKERMKRKMSQKGLEEFYYQLQHACKSLEKKYLERSENLALNTYVKKVEFNTIEEEIKDEVEFELYYPVITPEKYEKYKRLILGGKTVIQVASREGIDDLELERLLKADGIEYERGTIKIHDID